MSLFFQRKTQLSNFPFNLLSLELNNPIASSLLGNLNNVNPKLVFPFRSIKTEESNLLVGQVAPSGYLSAYFAGLKRVFR